MDQPSPGNRRRPRPTLSCLVCRRKKLKCDRQLPCGECKKTGKPSVCTFSNTVEHMHTNTVDSSVLSSEKRGAKRPRSSLLSESESPADISLGIIEDLQSRVKILESQLRRPSIEQGDDPFYPKPQQNTLNHAPANSQSFLRDKSYRASLVSPFDDVQKFLSKFREDPVLKPYVEEVRNIQKSLVKKERLIKCSNLSFTPSDSLASMNSMIPSKHDCDALVEFYLAKSEKTMRVLHIPSFQQSYERYWQMGRNESSLPFGFVPQLIAVIANASKSKRISPQERPSQLSWVSCCNILEAWLASLRRRERILLSTMQTRTILVMTQHDIFLPSDKTWGATGSLVRSGVSALLHRDPSLFPEISNLEAELRRRLWATILEIDLQASLISGGPTAIRAGDYETAPPSALDDSDLSEDINELPESKSGTEWTDSTLQVTLARSLPQRLQTAAFINAWDIASNDKDLRKHGEAIEQLLSSISPAARAETFYDKPSEDDAVAFGRILGRISLDLHIRRILLYLYRRVSFNNSDTTTFSFIRRPCRDSALIVLSYMDIFESHFQDETADIQSWRYIFETEFRYDTVLATLLICREIKTMGTSAQSENEPRYSEHAEGSEFEFQVPANDRHNLILWTRPRLIRIVESALSGLKQILDRPGSFLKDVLRVSIVLQSVRSNASPEKKMDLMREGAISVAKTLIQRVKMDNLNSLGSDSQDFDPERIANYENTINVSLTKDTDDLDSLESLMFDFGAGASLGIGESDFAFAPDWNLF